MNRRVIQKYIKKNFSLENIKLLCREVINNSELAEKNKVHIYVMTVPFFSNGYMCALKWKEIYNFSIYINVSSFLSKRELSNQMKWFYVYVTILHEFVHIDLVLNYRIKWTYSSYLAAVEEMREIKSIMFQRAVYQIMPGYKRKKKKYELSAVELFCRCMSLKNACEMFLPFLSEEEGKIITLIQNSAEFLVDHMEIGYSYNGMPYNKFNRSIVCASKIIKQDPGVLEKYPELKYIYTVDGGIKSIDKIFEGRNNENKEFIDCMLLQMFINLEQDYSLVFQSNNCLKNHIEFLANEYCNACIDYMEIAAIGTVFVEEEVLNDNALLLLKNAQYINKLMDKYNMKHTGGSLLYVEE